VRLLALALVGAALWPAAASAAAPSFFQTPSRNIGCVYASAEPGFPATLRCDIRSGLIPKPAKPKGCGLRPVPPRPRSCDLDWGYGYSMVGTGRASTFCAGDTAKDARAPVLAYGTTWRKGPFTCLSRAVGLRCTNRSRHGFFLSRERSYTF
jgi:hypothetical protein